MTTIDLPRLELYLDAASTTPLHPRAREAMLDALAEFGDPRRLYGRARRARLLLDRCREQVAAAVGALPDEVVLTSGGTEAADLREMADLDAQAIERETRR